MQDRRGFRTDLRSAIRFCSRHPLMSLTVVLTLAVGIGVNAAVFSVLNATYLKTLPIAAADRFVQIQSRNGGAFTYPEYLALKDVPGLIAVIAGGRTSTTLDSAVGEGRHAPARCHRHRDGELLRRPGPARRERAVGSSPRPTAVPRCLQSSS